MSRQKPHAKDPVEENESCGNRPCEAVGIIVPAEWDPNGNPIAWAISTYDENLYRIDTTGEKGRTLGSFLGRKMLLSGLLDETRDNHGKITVETYVLLDDKQQV